MRIASAETIGSVPILQIRRFLRETMHGSGWTLPYLQKRLSLTPQQARALLTQLHADGFVEPSPNHRDMWENTSNGNALASASAALALHRESAEKRLEEFLGRVQFVNSPECEFAYLVAKVVLIGSMLSKKARVSDIDVSVRLDRKYVGDAFAKALEDRKRLAQQTGRSFKSSIDMIFWPEREVWLHLKDRSRSISLIAWDEKWLETQPHKVIYERKP